MARYKHIDTSPRLIAVDLQQQLLPSTIEHALHHLLDHHIDLSALDANDKNDTTGATAYPPAMLLKMGHWGHVLHHSTRFSTGYDALQDGN